MTYKIDHNVGRWFITGENGLNIHLIYDKKKRKAFIQVTLPDGTIYRDQISTSSMNYLKGFADFVEEE